ncbi:MFS transporter [Elizabethkingia anophelis]|nr:MFS transporter [Elizabethkingia anophelis]
MLNNTVNFLHNSYKGFSLNLWLLSITIFINRSGAMVIPFLGIYLINKLNFSIDQIGIVLSIYGLGAIIGSNIGGKLTDKIGTFNTQIICLFLSVPFYIALPFILNLKDLCIIFFILGIINECFSPANSLAIVENSDEENRTRAFSLNRTAINIGFFIGPSLGGVLSTLSYSYIFYANAISSFLAGILLFFLFKKKKIKTDTYKRKFIKSNLSPYKDRLFITFFIFIIVYTFCFMQFLNTIPLFYKEVAGLSNIEIGMIFGYEGILLFMLEMPLIYWINKKLGINSIILIGFILLFLSYILLAFNDDMFIIFLVSTFMVISEILILPFLSTITSFRSNNRNEGAYMGMYNSSFSIALFLSPYISSYLASKFGYQNLWLLIALLVGISWLGINSMIYKMKVNKIVE